MELTVDMLESKERMKELNPLETLKELGFGEGMTFCDIGAGSGTFSFPAAELSKNDIYSLELDDDLIEFINHRKAEKYYNHIYVRKVKSKALPISDDSCDLVMMAEVLHEIEDKMTMYEEIKRGLKKNGKLVIIEYLIDAEGDWPPKEYRVNPNDVKEMTKSLGFELEVERKLGDHYYLLSLRLVR
ncbi:MAG: class I SAM-dependent methyltransferase [Firmicutes bacterium]|jgi:ubiquinone/menaquinone biosynthesis C-methylase UbiE|nr:class I SAM-dependent methyltransferase [Bacillota bacterium]